MHRSSTAENDVLEFNKVLSFAGTSQKTPIRLRKVPKAMNIYEHGK